MKPSSLLSTHLRLALLLAILPACTHFQSQPLALSTELASLESSRLNDSKLREFVRAVRGNKAWPPAAWDLDALSMAALYFHPEVELARREWQEAQGAVITAKQWPNPSVILNPAYNTTSAIPSPWIAPINFDWLLETAGKRNHRQEKAVQLAESARQRYLAKAYEVRARVRAAMLEAFAARETEALLGKQQAAREDLVKVLEGQLAAGEATPVEVARERITREQTKLALLDARGKRQQAQVKLATAVGLSARALDAVQISFTDFEHSRALPSSEARRRAILGRPDMQGALADYAASEAALRLEIAKQYPDVHLGPGYLYDQGDNKWGLYLTVELPILNHNKGGIAEAEAKRGQSAAKFRVVQNKVLGEIELALAALSAAREKEAAAQALAEQTDKQEKLTQKLLETGEVMRQNLVLARIESSTAAQAKLEAHLKALEAIGQLEAALQSPLELPASLFALPKTISSHSKSK